MRFFLQNLLDECHQPFFPLLFLSLQDELVWHTTFPDGRWSGFRCVHLLTRCTPLAGDKGATREWTWIAVFPSMLDRLHEISRATAERLDPRLVELACQLPLPPTLEVVRQQMPRGARLLFIECGRTPDEQWFDVYRNRGVIRPLVYLNPLLEAASLLPTCLLDGTPRVVIPFASQGLRGGSLLAQTLAVRLWGEQTEEPAYPFDLDFA